MKLGQSLNIIHQSMSIILVLWLYIFYYIFLKCSSFQHVALTQCIFTGFFMLFSGLHTTTHPLLIVYSVENSQDWFNSCLFQAIWQETKIWVLVRPPFVSMQFTIYVTNPSQIFQCKMRLTIVLRMNKNEWMKRKIRSIKNE